MKIAGAKNLKQFYEMFPTEDDFKAKYGKELKKLQRAEKIKTAAGGIQQPGDTSMHFLNDPETGQQFSHADMYGQEMSGIAPMQPKFTPIPMPGVDNKLMTSTSPTKSSGFDFSKVNKFMGPAGKIGEGIANLIKEKKGMKNSQMWEDVSDVALAASRTKAEQPERRYVRPEDTQNTGEEFFPVYGVGTNALAKNGTLLNRVGGNPTEIANFYNPETPTQDLGYEPLSETKLKSYFRGGKLEQADLGSILGAGGSDVLSKGAGALFDNNAGSQIGGAVGDAVGMIPGIGPVAKGIAKPILTAIGGIADPYARRKKQADNAIKNNMGNMAFGDAMKGVQGQFSGYMEDGGYVSNDWTPQLITKFGEHNLSELLKDDPTMDTLRTGGNLRVNELAMGGDLKVMRGKAKPISNNPYDQSETIMFEGPSHEEGGMPIAFGNSPVEVEGKEPAVKMKNGGEADSLVVYGNLVIGGPQATMLGDPKAKNKKFKNYIAEISKEENKNSKILDKSTDQLDELDVRTSFDKLTLAALTANIQGANMNQKALAEKKAKAASLQQAINETADEHGLEADELAKGNIKMAKKGATIRKAEGGDELEYLSPENYDKLQKMYDAAKAQGKGKAVEDFQREFAALAPNRAKAALKSVGLGQTNYAKKLNPALDAFDPAGNIDQYFGKRTEAYRAQMGEKGQPALTPSGWTTDETISAPEDNIQISEPVSLPGAKKKQGLDWMTAINSMVPYMRPSNAEGLDPRQLSGEMFALSQNQLQPVKAQSFTPQLTVPYDISLQDILNENTATTRAAQRMAGYNPAAQANLAAQQYGANQKVLGEQFRMNQEMKNKTYAQNREALDKAKLVNLEQFEKQSDKQAGALSATKATTQAALNSIADKYAKHELENKTLQTYENMYGYRFGPGMRAINMNPLAQFNIPDVGSTTGVSGTISGPNGETLYPQYKNGKLTGYEPLATATTDEPVPITPATKKVKGRNGSIVSEWKRI